MVLLELQYLLSHPCQIWVCLVYAESLFSGERDPELAVFNRSVRDFPNVFVGTRDCCAEWGPLCVLGFFSSQSHDEITGSITCIFVLLWF